MAHKLGGVLLDQYADFPVGGVADDAAWTGFMWNRLAGWVADGTPDEMPVNRFQSSQRRLLLSADDRPTSQRLRKKWIQAMKPLLLHTTDMFHIQELSAVTEAVKGNKRTGGVSIGFSKEFLDGLLVNASKLYIEVFANEYVLPILLEGVEDATVIKEIHSKVIQLTKEMMHVLENKDEAGLQEQVGSVERVKEHGVGVFEHEMYGASITTGEWSKGGGMDVLIGSPGAGSSGSPQAGSASLYFHSHNSTPSILKFMGKRSHEYTHAYERFGWASASCDINVDGKLDMILCAPTFGGNMCIGLMMVILLL